MQCKYDGDKLSHKHPTKEPINAPQVKLDAIHLYHNQTV